MLEHLVQSHLGGYYISCGDPEFIEAYCDTCGDYDVILTSWNEDEENARLNALLSYFINSDLNTKKDLEEKIVEYKDYVLDEGEIIPTIIEDINFNDEETSSIINGLYEYHEISEEEKDKIIEISNFNAKRQIKMVKHFESTYFSKDKDGKVKVLKKSN